MDIVNLLASWWWVLALIGLVVFYKLVLRLFGAVIIPGNAVGVVRKRWVLFGSNRTLPNGQIIALQGEAGYQADTLAPGLHWGFWPWQYDINVVGFVDIPEGKVAVVDARDGAPLTDRVFGREVACNAYQDARVWTQQPGERDVPVTNVAAVVRHERVARSESGPSGRGARLHGDDHRIGEIADDQFTFIDARLPRRARHDDSEPAPRHGELARPRLQQRVAHGSGVSLVHHRRYLDAHAHQPRTRFRHAASELLDLADGAVELLSDRPTLGRAQVLAIVVQLRERIHLALEPSELALARIGGLRARRTAHDAARGALGVQRRVQRRTHGESGGERGEKRSAERAGHRNAKNEDQKLLRRRLAGSAVLSCRIVASRWPSVVK